MKIKEKTIWDDAKQEVSAMDEMENSFYERNGAGEKEKAEKLFDNIQPIDGGIADEFGFVTEKITEKTFHDTIAEFDSFITRIRVGF